MNFNFPQDKFVNLNKYWSWLHSQVLKVINKKVIAYKGELEYELELRGVGHFDTGRSIEYLSKLAPIKYITIKEVEINNNPMDFYYFKKTKKVKVENTLKKKKEAFERYLKKAGEFGQFVHRDFYPRVFKNLNFIVEHIEARRYNLIDMGEIDIILSSEENNKIFVDVKNTLPFYDKDLLYKFLKKLEVFNFKIIPLVISRGIYERPLEILNALGGTSIELKKVIVPQKYKEYSKEFNEHFVDITRVIPEQLIPIDIKRNFSVVKDYKEGRIFFEIDIDSYFRRERYEEPGPLDLL